jgi:hypothetical protein
MTNGGELIRPNQMPSSDHRETSMAHSRLSMLMRIMARRKNAATERHTIMAILRPAHPPSAKMRSMGRNSQA